MNLDLCQRSALVCGSSQGIGKACAIELAQLGCNVTLFARNETSLAKVLTELDTSKKQKHQILIADFTDPKTVENALAAHLALGNTYHILINNTGGPAPGLAIDAAPTDFIAAFNLHLINNQIITKHLVSGMKNSNFGRIINVISTSVKQPIPGLGVSNTIRGAVASWAKTLAGELGQFGITVNNVLPGATATGRLDAIFANKAKKLNISIDEVITQEKNQIPLRRFAQPSEFAAVVGFLASPAAAYITGINLPVDGGRTLSL